jgi:PAS domain S-box-containing protein
VKNVKWVTRERAKVDRIACPWLIKRFVDPDAEFLYVPKDLVSSVAKAEGATPFDTPGAELNHYEVDGDVRCSFDAIIRKYDLKDPALLDMAEIVRTADSAPRNPRREGAGLESFALGFRKISKNDFDNIRLQFPAYDALYAYCKLKVENKEQLEHAVEIGYAGTPGPLIADVKECMSAEEKLKESEARLRLILDSTAEAIYGLDMLGNCTFCNNSCLRLLGYERPDDLLGKNMHWLIHAKHSDGTPIPIEECRIYQVLTRGVGMHVKDEVLWRSDGTSFPVEYWSHPQFRDGALVGAVVTFLEITERKNVEHQVQERKKELQAFYRLSEIAQKKGITIEDLYLEVANFLPESWQYPEITCARIVIGNKEFRTENFKDTTWKQSSPVRVFDTIVGGIDIVYLEEKAELDEGPFMKEERLLIDAIAELIGHITERKLVEESVKK